MLEEQYMRRAIRLAGLGLGQTNPNPMVGAVIVKNGRVIGEPASASSRRWASILRSLAFMMKVPRPSSSTGKCSPGRFSSSSV